MNQPHAPWRSVRYKRAFQVGVDCQRTIPPNLVGQGCLDWEPHDASASLTGRDIAGGDLILVGCKRSQDFGSLALRDLDNIQRPSELRRNLIEVCGRDPAVSMGFRKTERRPAWVGRCKLKGPSGHTADPECPH